MISESKAAQVLYAAHENWNRRDLAALLDLFDDDMIYWSNVWSNADAERSATIRHGKAEFLAFLDGMQHMEGLSVPHSFRFANGLASANVEFYLRDQHSGYSHSGTYRQVVSFRGNRILRMDEYHDAAALASFLALLHSEASSDG